MACLLGLVYARGSLDFCKGSSDMARTRRTTRQVQPIFVETAEGEELNATEQLVEQDQAEVAGIAGEIINSLSGLAAGDAKVNVYRIPNRGGKWAYITSYYPPISPFIIEELQEKFGGGSFQLRVFGNGRIITTKQVDIEGPPKYVGAEEPKATTDITEVLLTQANQSKADMRDMMTVLMNISAENNKMLMMFMQDSNNRSMDMMKVLLPLLAGGKETPGSLLAGLAPFLQMFKTGQNSTAETIDLVTKVKELFGDGGGEKGMIESLATSALPLLTKLTDGSLGLPQGGFPPGATSLAPHMGYGLVAAPNGPAGPQPQIPAGYEMVGPEPVDLMQPPPPIMVGGQPLSEETATLVRMIGPDVVYFAVRGHDPSLAAEAIVSLIDKAQVKDECIQELVLRFTQSADWINDLSAAGYNLQSARQWCLSFLPILVNEWTSTRQEQTNT